MNHITMATDGSSLGNPGRGGYGTILISGERRKEISDGYRYTTNSRMELMAVIKGLQALKNRCQVTVYSDSKYVVDAINQGWLQSWQVNGWKKSGGKPVLNIDLWVTLLDLLSAHEVQFVWVKGHAGNPENRRCDYLAKKAAERDDLPPDEGYENSVYNFLPGGFPGSGAETGGCPF